MPAAYHDESSDGFDDGDYPDEDDVDDDLTDTVVCAHCGADVYEDAAQCPACGLYLLPDTRVWSGKPLWWVTLALLGILAVVLALALGL
jgi:predicted amidophosphoribosyltransferase